MNAVLQALNSSQVFVSMMDSIAIASSDVWVTVLTQLFQSMINPKGMATAQQLLQHFQVKY